METYLLCLGIVLGGSVWVRYLAAPNAPGEMPERSLRDEKADDLVG